MIMTMILMMDSTTQDATSHIHIQLTVHRAKTELNLLRPQLILKRKQRQHQHHMRRSSSGGSAPEDPFRMRPAPDSATDTSTPSQARQADQLLRQRLQLAFSVSEPVSHQDVHEVAAIVPNSDDVSSARREYPARRLVAVHASTAPPRYDVRAILADPNPEAFVTHFLFLGKPPARKKAAYLASVVAESTHRETFQDNSAGTAPICIDAAVRVTR